MTAEVRYGSGPEIERQSGPNRGEAVLWVQVGKSEYFRPVRLTNQDLIEIALNCLKILAERNGK